MIRDRFEQTASTSLDFVLPETDERAGTDLAQDVVGVRVARPGLFIAGLVLSAALTTGGTVVTLADPMRRRTDDVAAALQAFRRAVPQAYRLSPGATYRRFRVSKRTVLDAMRDQALVEMPAWKRHMTEQKRRQKPDGIDK